MSVCDFVRDIPFLETLFCKPEGRVIAPDEDTIAVGKVKEIKPQIRDLMFFDDLHCHCSRFHPKAKGREVDRVSEFCEVGLDARLHGDKYVEMALSESGLDHGNVTVAHWWTGEREIKYSSPMKLNDEWRWVSIWDRDQNGRLNCGDQVRVNWSLDKVEGFEDYLFRYNYGICNDPHPDVTKQVEAAYQKALEWIGFI
ncbi:MAG: hypothetical protein WC683_12425 [bacterium]